MAIIPAPVYLVSALLIVFMMARPVWMGTCGVDCGAPDIPRLQWFAAAAEGPTEAALGF
jgi:hypothetical protein